LAFSSVPKVTNFFPSGRISKIFFSKCSKSPPEQLCYTFRCHPSSAPTCNSNSKYSSALNFFFHRALDPFPPDRHMYPSSPIHPPGCP
jgi:hypothetical protein